MARQCDFPVFDADNHLYETQDAFTRHLPKQYRGAIDYVDVRGRTKIAVRGQISEYIPNPTFDVVARPGALEEWVDPATLTAVWRRCQEGGSDSDWFAIWRAAVAGRWLVHHGFDDPPAT